MKNCLPAFLIGANWGERVRTAPSPLSPQQSWILKSGGASLHAMANTSLLGPSRSGWCGAVPYGTGKPAGARQPPASIWETLLPKEKVRGLDPAPASGLQQKQKEVLHLYDIWVE